MIQVYTPYWEWEDWINGMWRKCDDEPGMLVKAIEFTGNWALYGAAMLEVSIAWPRTMLNSLTNMNINPRAFIGHCACSYKFGCPEHITRAAWKVLTDQQRYDADTIAQKHVDQWRKNYENTFRDGNEIAIKTASRMKGQRTYSTRCRPISESLLPL